LRCFIGAFLAADPAARLQGLIPPVPGFRPVPAKNLHVTLRFFGEQSPDEAQDIVDWLATRKAGNLACEMVALTGLPSPPRAHVLALELRPGPALDALQRQIAKRFGPPDRPFRPHVTLARSRRTRAVTPVHLPPGQELRLLPPQLYRSETLPSGARYTPVFLS